LWARLNENVETGLVTGRRGPQGSEISQLPHILDSYDSDVVGLTFRPHLPPPP
jgi:hypothetical protein